MSRPEWTKLKCRIRRVDFYTCLLSGLCSLAVKLCCTYPILDNIKLSIRDDTVRGYHSVTFIMLGLWCNWQMTVQTINVIDTRHIFHSRGGKKKQSSADLMNPVCLFMLICHDVSPWEAAFIEFLPSNIQSYVCYPYKTFKLYHSLSSHYWLKNQITSNYFTCIDISNISVLKNGSSSNIQVILSLTICLS